MGSTLPAYYLGLRGIAWWIVLWFVSSSLWAQDAPTIYRVSFAERSDGKGHVVRLHATASVENSEYEVDLLGRNQVLVLLHGARLADNIQEDPPIGPIVDYSTRQRRQRVEIRLRLSDNAPVNIVYYPDRASSDFLLSLNRSGSYPTLTDPPRTGVPATTSEPVATVVENERQEEADDTRMPEILPPEDSNSQTGVDQESQVSAPPDAENQSAETTPAHTQGSAESDLEPVAVGRAVRLDGPVLPSEPPVQEELATNVDAWRLDCIVIDAGHGGKDPGTMGHGLREKDVALSIALKLGRLVEEQLGLKVVFTRTDDRFIELQQRGKIANEAGGKLFVSIHVDGIGGSRARTVKGTSTYFLGLHRTEAATRVMEKENAVVKLESDPDRYAAFNDDHLIVRTLAQSAYLEKSEQLAARIQTQFESHARRTSRGVKQAGLIVLWAASMPAVLVETGFATHPNESKYLLSEQGQTQIAESIFRALAEFKSDYESDLGLSARTTE